MGLIAINKNNAVRKLQVKKNLSKIFLCLVLVQILYSFIASKTNNLS